MLDWTTSFLSDETIIKPREESVKQFLWAHYIQKDAGASLLQIDVMKEKCPAACGACDENQEATPVALEDQPYLLIEKAIRGPGSKTC